jgi:hypothetical protein
MTDEDLVRAFEAGSLEEFPHESHVRVAWWYLRQDPVLVALPRFRTALQRFAAAKGKPDMYHETITVAYVLLIAERLAGARDLSWDEFARRNPELLRRHPSALAKFYPAEVLASAKARERFVMPS